MHTYKALITVFIAFIFGASPTLARDCQSAWEKERVHAVNEKNTTRIEFLDALLPIPVQDRTGLTVCNAKLLEDISDNNDLIVASNFNQILLNRTMNLKYTKNIDIRKFVNGLNDAKVVFYLDSRVIDKIAGDIALEKQQGDEKIRDPLSEVAAANAHSIDNYYSSIIFAGLPISSEIKRLIFNSLNRDSGIGSNLCDKHYGYRCAKIYNFCVQPKKLDEVDRLNGLLEEKNIGVKIIFQEDSGKWSFGLRRVDLQRTRFGWKVDYIGDAYGENCGGISDD